MAEYWETSILFSCDEFRKQVLSLKAPEKDEEEVVQEATVSFAAAKTISVDALLSELDDIFTLRKAKEQH